MPDTPPDNQTLPPDSRLPADADAVLRLAAQSLFGTLAGAALGMFVVDRQHRIVWISEGYRRFLPALGHAEDSFIGKRVEEVVPGTLMPQVVESGRPILVDLLTNQAGSFVVSRLPLRDAGGAVIGAIGMVLMDRPETTMQPLLAKFARLERELGQARAQLAAQRRPKHTLASFVGTSAAAVEVKRQARRAATIDSTVLLLGETGTGKELLAHGIHAASARASKPFVGVNIAAIPESLLEAELFGVVAGAFTGADRKGRDGKFSCADGGTLLLDEIGDLSLALQSKLLRVLEERQVEPLGSNQVLRLDVRFIAATSRNLAAMVAAGTFRADLYYRLNVLPIRVPPLRERLGDLEALTEALAEDIARRSGLVHKELSTDALECLARHAWPGNIRELRNALEQATLMTDDALLTAQHFVGIVPAAAAPAPSGTPGAAQARDAQPAPAGAPAVPAMAGPRRPDVLPLPRAVADLQLQAIRAALEATGGNKVAASKMLGISRATLYEKLGKLVGKAGE